MGVLDRLAGDRALGLGVADLADTDKSLAAMIATGKRLRDEDGADVLIMGCAGMSKYLGPLRDATGLPVVEPSQAAVSIALGQIALGQIALGQIALGLSHKPELSRKRERPDHVG
jgi:Asp/Glu/hydantoin racemase